MENDELSGSVCLVSYDPWVYLPNNIIEVLIGV